MSSQNRIPVHEPEIGNEEIESVVAALRRGEISGSFGQALPEFEDKFADFVGCKYGVAVTSGTTALQLAVQAAGVGTAVEVCAAATRPADSMVVVASAVRHRMFIRRSSTG